MTQTSTSSKIVAGKILRSKITIHLEKHPDGSIYCFLSDGFTDGPVMICLEAQEFANLLSEKLGADVFFDSEEEE